MKVNVLPAILTLTGSTACAGAATTIISSTSQNGVNYQLYNSSNVAIGSILAGTTGGLTWSGISAAIGYYVIGTNTASACTSTSNAVAITVNPTLTASLSITATATAICAGTSVTFTATPTNGGAAPAYQWKLNGTNVGSNSATYTNSALANGNVVTCVLTSNATPCLTGSPATSNGITMTVNPGLTASVSITASATIICAGTSVTFTATATNGGTTPTYQWLLNGVNVGLNSATYTNTALANGSTVTCVLTSNLTSCLTGSPATSNGVTMTVNNTSAPAAAAQTFCSVNAPTVANLTATGTAIQWYSAATSGTALASTTPLATGIYFASQTVSGCESTTRTSVSVSVSTPIAGTITASATSICTGSSSLLTLTGNDGTIQWQVSTTSSTTGFTNIVGATSNTYNAVGLTSSRWYRAKVSKSNCPAVYTLVRLITVTTVPAVGGTLSSSVTICSGSGTTLTLAGSSGTIIWQYSTNWTAATPTWYTVTGQTTTSLATGALTASRAYRAKLTSGSCISYSNQVVVTVNPLSAVSSISGSGAFCIGSTVNLTLTSATGTIQWQESPTSTGTFTNIVGANGLTYTISNLQSTKSYRVVVTSGVCSSIISSVKTVICSPLAVGGTITSNQGALICPGTIATFTLTGSVGTRQWQSSTDGVVFTDIAASVAATKAIVISSPIWVRVKLTSGSCQVQYSNVIFTNVLPGALGGVISGESSIMVNTGTTLAVTGSVGTKQWQRSTDGLTFTGISASNTATLATGNLPVSTSYRVRATVGTCIAYSPVFTVTVYGGRSSEITLTSFGAVAYPNPFADNFMLEISASTDEMIEVNVFDMLGKLVENHQVNVSDLSTFVIGNKFVSGVYNIEVIQGTQIERLRVVKN